MMFSIENLLTLAVVLVVLVVYRQMDRGNRSLDKLRRYADKVKDDIDAVVLEKVQYLKDLSIELDVHQKAAKEVLKRTQALEETMKTRFSGVDAIGNRIGEYDTILGDLVQMTKRVEENINRIKEESLFTDTVAKRIRALNERMDEQEKRFPELVARFQDLNTESLGRSERIVFERSEQRVQELGALLAKTEERVSEFSSVITVSRTELDESRKRFMQEAETAQEAMLRTLAEDAAAELRRADESLERYREEMDELQAEYGRRLEEAARRGTALETEALAALKNEIDAHFAALRDLARDKADELQGSLYNSVQESEGRLTDMQVRQSKELASVETRLTQDIAVKMDAIVADMEKRMGSVESRSDASVRQIDENIADLKGRVDGWISRAAEIDRKMQEHSAHVQSRLDVLHSGLDEARELGNEAAERMARLREHMEKEDAAFAAGLQKFSAEFNARVVRAGEDAERSVFEALEAKLGEYERDMRYRFDRVEEVGRDIEALEQGLRESKDKAVQLIRDEFSQFGRTIEQARQADFDRQKADIQAMRAEMDALEGALNELKLRAYDNVSEKLKVFEDEFFNGLRRRDDDMQERLGEWQQRMGGALEDLERSSTAQIERRLEESRATVAVWQSRLSQEMKAIEADISGHFASLRVQTTETIGNLRDEFTSQRDDLSAAADGERLRLREELRVMGAETEQRIREFKSLLQDMREQYDGMYQKLFGRLEDGYKTLSASLSEIDKKQRNFLDQTKLFERADSLRVSLTQDIDELKSDLARVDTQRKELREFETQLLRLRKLGEEATEKMSRFMAEKRRLDGLEEDYHRLSALSQAVEQKLEQVGGSNDTLQSMLVSLRTLDQLQTDVESRFERLEKKKDVLDTTIEGVDRGFQTLNDLEDRFKDVSNGLESVGTTVAALTKKVQTLAAGKPAADKAMQQLTAVDKLLSDLEKRSEKLVKAREWIAKTETRLEEIKRDAQEQVKLLGSLLKEEKTSVKREKSAASLSARETVTKLARQGWSVEQIVRATKLSRGEVELILELSGK